MSDATATPRAKDGARPTIRRCTLGPFETNCYIISVPPDKACWIVDASWDSEELVEAVRAEGLVPAAIILTHAHVDHIAGLGALRRSFPGVPVLLHGAERDWLSDPLLNLSAVMGMPVSEAAPDAELTDGQVLTLGGERWTVLHTPGHSPGGITLVHEPSKTAIVGDSLFAGSIGRTDFPGSNHEQLARSIRTRLYTLPDDTVIWPGHGPESTIGREKRSNPFVRP